MVSDLFPPPVFEDDILRDLRRRVREFLAHELANGGFTPAVDSWMSAWDPEFTRKLAQQGWLGMTIPAEYGGHGATYLERFVVTEELLAAGAPVTAHWFADRQVAPSLLKFGSQEQKQTLLPRIVDGSVLFAIGMSEPDSGSDLASVRTKATRADGGWSLTGSKVWTSNAHKTDYAIALVRTSPFDQEHRHAGMSQLIIDLHTAGVEIRRINSLNGEHHFNEVHLDGAFVPDSMVLGTVGDGWKQVTSELGFERSGPERFLSTQRILEELVLTMRVDGLEVDAEIGRFFARLMGLHQMSISVAGALARDEPAEVAAGVVKNLGTVTEGDLTEYAAKLLDSDDTSAVAALRAATERSLLLRPGYTLRGGTNEILRGVIARGLGVR